MTHPSIAADLKARLRLPVIGAPLFIISHPPLVLAQCRAGIVGSFPSLNARPIAQLDEWLTELHEQLTPADAPFAVNLIVHKSNARLEQDVALVVKHRAPIVITSLGAVPEVNEAVHSYGGIVLHDVTNQRHARKAIAKGADGLILVASGAGGHAGTQSPFALTAETRAWFDGPIALSGAIATGAGVLAAEAAGADFAYVGSAFIATDEARASEAYKAAIVEGTAAEIVYTNLFTGVHGNYLKSSVVAAGLDPDNLPEADPSKMNFGSGDGGAVKAWRDIWGAGQGVGSVDAVLPVAGLIDRLQREYRAARERIGLPGHAVMPSEAGA
ncbi:MAG: nitronate monooxygenase family protein [Sphingomonadaceae bacterium]|nr:nitronate monooxygenase family protein [Sphingomonadaceae bacterium]